MPNDIPYLKPGRDPQTLADNVITLINAGFSEAEAKESVLAVAGYKSREGMSVIRFKATTTNGLQSSIDADHFDWTEEDSRQLDTAIRERQAKDAVEGASEFSLAVDSCPVAPTPATLARAEAEVRFTGTRHWYELSGTEQDEYLLSCFKGEATRLATEQRVDLYDPIARSIAHFLLDDRYEIEPAEEREALEIRFCRTLALQNTLLGRRLIKAIVRAEVTAKSLGALHRFDYSQDPMLFFEHLDLFAKTRGFEMLSFACVEDFKESERTSTEEWEALPPSERERATTEWGNVVAECAPIPTQRATPAPTLSRHSWSKRFKKRIRISFSLITRIAPITISSLAHL